MTCECLFFNGTGYIDAGSNSSLRPVGTGLSISFWIKLTATNAIDGARIISTLGPGNLNGFDVFVGAGAGGSINQVWFQFGEQPNFYFLSAGALTPGLWYNIICLYNNVNAAAILVNGTSVASISTTATDLGAGTGNLQIGNFQFQSGDILNNAELMDVRVWNFCLNFATDGPAIYNSGCPSFTDVTTGYSQLVGWWKLNEGTGTTANDSSASGNTGTLTGSPVPVWTGDCPCPVHDTPPMGTIARAIDEALFEAGQVLASPSFARQAASQIGGVRPRIVAAQENLTDYFAGSVLMGRAPTSAPVVVATSPARATVVSELPPSTDHYGQVYQSHGPALAIPLSAPLRKWVVQAEELPASLPYQPMIGRGTRIPPIPGPPVPQRTYVVVRDEMPPEDGQAMVSMGRLPPQVVPTVPCPYRPGRPDSGDTLRNRPMKINPCRC